MNPIQKRIQDRIMTSSTKVPDTGCWIWNRQISNSGYGRIALSDGTGTTAESAHRASYLAFVGPLGRDELVSQTCGNRLCVNPDHLVLAAQKQELCIQ